MVWWHLLCPTGGEGICALLSPFLCVPFPSIPWEAREVWKGTSLCLGLRYPPSWKVLGKETASGVVLSAVSN